MSHRRLLVRALFVGALGASSTASASEPHATIVIGEVSARATDADTATVVLFRHLVEREIGRLELDHRTRPPAYVFSASLVRLDAHASPGGSSAVCIVSGALRRAGNGALVAVMHGTGSVDGDRTALPGTRERALEVAVHGAVRHLPEAI